jgi:hypothetical protein
VVIFGRNTMTPKNLDSSFEKKLDIIAVLLFLKFARLYLINKTKDDNEFQQEVVFRDIIGYCLSN